VPPAKGSIGMLSYGIGYGMWLGIFATLEIPVTQIHPLTWKSKMCAGMPSGKDASRVRAMELFGSKVDLSLKKHHGRADAILIAEYMKRFQFATAA
jgi:hypothetical protein